MTSQLDSWDRSPREMLRSVADGVQHTGFGKQGQSLHSLDDFLRKQLLLLIDSKAWTH